MVKCVEQMVQNVVEEIAFMLAERDKMANANVKVLVI